MNPHVVTLPLGPVLLDRRLAAGREPESHVGGFSHE